MLKTFFHLAVNLQVIISCMEENVMINYEKIVILFLAIISLKNYKSFDSI